jgi:hypothetical protein
LDYPNNFSVPAFPAGKTVALTRTVSVWISIVFFLIVAMCCFILLGIHYKTNYPFLISIDPITDEWNIVAYPNETHKPKQRYEFMQEKLVNDFIINWFTISNNKEINESRWMECSVDECKDAEQFNPENTLCALMCKCDSAVFKEFNTNVLPLYNAIVNDGAETWRVVGKMFTPVVVLEDTGKWQVHAVIQSSKRGYFEILGFIDIARNTDLYPATFGYYVKQFNSYRITQ